MQMAGLTLERLRAGRPGDKLCEGNMLGLRPARLPTALAAAGTDIDGRDGNRGFARLRIEQYQKNCRYSSEDLWGPLRRGTAQLAFGLPSGPIHPRCRSRHWAKKRTASHPSKSADNNPPVKKRQAGAPGAPGKTPNGRGR